MGARGPKRKLQSADQVQQIIDAYFNKCEGIKALDESGNPIMSKYGPVYTEEPKPITINGLGLALGYAGRQGLFEIIKILEDDDDEESNKILDSITRAKAVVEEYAEKRTYDREGTQGGQFTLKNNFGWNDKVTIDGTINVALLDDPDDSDDD